MNGVRITNVQELAAPDLLTSSGKVFFEIDSSEGNVFGLFAQSLGSFGAGQRMPTTISNTAESSVRRDGAASGDQLLFYFDGRNGQDCRLRWTYSQNPTIKRGSWPPAEDAKLRGHVIE